MTGRRKTLLLAHDFPPMPGGIARALGAIARHSPEVIVSTGSAGGARPEDSATGARVVRVDVPPDRLRTLGGLLRWRRSARRILAEAGVTFAWAGNLKPAGHVARWLGVPFGLLVYGLDLALLEAQAARSPRRRLAARLILSRAAGTVAISRFTAERYRALAHTLDLPRAAERVRVVPLGADPVRFCPDGPHYPLGPGSWLLSVSRLLPHKGIDIGIEAFAALRETHPDLGYAVAGAGPDRGRLEALARSLGVGARLRFLGEVADDDLPALYRAATICLGLSRPDGPEIEGFGLALAEAQASGRPVIAGASGGVPDAVDDGVTGLLVAPTDRTGVVRAITGLLAAPERRRAMGGAGRERVERYLNWDRVVADLRAAEEDWVAGRSS